MEFLETISIVLAIFLGIVTSYEDIKFGKIRNKYIFFGISAALILNLKNLFLGPSYFIATLVNFMISFILGFVLWYFHFWTAGDAKIFATFSFLLPLSLYNLRHIVFFPSFEIFLNTFLLLFITLSVNLLIKTDWKEKTMIFKRILKPKFLLNVFFLLFGLLWGVYLIFSYFGIKTNFILLLLPLTLIIIILKDLLETHLIIVSVLLSIIRIIFDPSIFTLTFFLIFVFRYMIFIFLFGFLFNLSFFMFVFPVKIEKLKKGMLPIEAIIQKGKKCGKVIFELTPKMLKYKFLIKPKPKGLSEEDIRIIKKLYKEKKLDFDTLLVQQTLPFAPFIFIGLLITIFCHGSCIDFIKLFIFI